MSYHTKFTGQFDLDKTLTLEQFNILNDFAETDHRTEQGVPDIWCDWVPAKDGKAIACAGNDVSFYNYDEWLEYLIKHFLQPWGYALNGSARWQGEETGDTGTLSVRNNVVTMLKDEESRSQAEHYLIEALSNESAHHKQWYLWQIAKALGLELDIDADPGVAP